MSSSFNHRFEEDDTILLRLAFIAWKNHHLRQKNDWRLEIKADVHHSLQLQTKVFKKWQLYILEQRKELIRNKISEIFYEKKIKLTYFLNLRWYTKERLYYRRTEPILISGLVFCYCQLEVLISSYIYVNSRLNYLAVKYDEMKWRTKHLKTYFNKLLYYVNGRITKRNLEFKLRLFLKSKYDPKILHPYLKIWIDFTNHSTNRKRKLGIADKFHQNKLIHHSFIQLLRYKDYSQSKRAKLILANDTYEAKIKKFILRSWIDFTNQKLFETNKIVLANSYYEHRLKRMSFIKLYRYNNYKRNKIKLALFVEEIYLTKLKQHYYTKLKLYYVYSKKKRLKFNQACTYYDAHLKQYYFTKIKEYYHYKMKKRLTETATIEIFERGQNLRRLKTYFNKLKLLKIISRKEKELEQKSQIFYTKIVCKRAFFTWFQYMRTKQYFRARNDNLIKKIWLLKWKNYTRREIQYRNKLEVAKTIYEKHLLSKALVFVLKAGDREQDFKKRKALNSYEKHFQLQSKYYLIWKRKALGNVSLCQRSNSNCALKIDCDEMFQWNSLCFQQPKIPDNLYNLFL